MSGWTMTSPTDRFAGPVLGLAGATASGTYGLPHAFHGEVVAEAGDVRDVAARAIDVTVAVLGPCRGEVHAVMTDGCVTITAQWLPGVVVTLIAGLAVAGADEINRYRLLGSGGQAYIDVTGPAFTLVGPERSTVAYGPSPAERAAGTSGAADELVAAVLDACQRSAASGQPESV